MTGVQTCALPISSICFIVALALLNHQFIFGGSRSHLIGIVAAIIFTISYTLFILTNFRLVYKITGFVAILLALGFGISKFSNRNAVRSLLLLSPLIEGFKSFDSIIKAEKDNFKFSELEVKLFHDNRDKNRTFVEPSLGQSQVEDKLISYLTEVYTNRIKKASEKFIKKKSKNISEQVALLIGKSADNFDEHLQLVLDESAESIMQVSKERLEEQNKKFLEFIRNNVVLPLFQSQDLEIAINRATVLAITKIVTRLKKEKIKILQDIIEKENQNHKNSRSIGIAYGNMLFRIFIWRDMIYELLTEKAIWGINWGKPQRSKSIEILKLAETEWQRDGWITPHNSFLHVIYRAGIIGLLIIASFFLVFCRLLKDFIKVKSVVGGLLLGIFVYWLTIDRKSVV